MKQLLIFIMFAAMLCWLMFSPIYKHVLIVRQAALQQEVDYLLEIGAGGMNGYVNGAMLEQSRDRLERFGMGRSAIDYELYTTSGVDASNEYAPVPRGTGIYLEISYPYENLFLIDSLIGMTPLPPGERMRAFGLKMSEYVP